MEIHCVAKIKPLKQLSESPIISDDTNRSRYVFYCNKLNQNCQTVYIIFLSHIVRILWKTEIVHV